MIAENHANPIFGVFVFKMYATDALLESYKMNELTTGMQKYKLSFFVAQPC